MCPNCDFLKICHILVDVDAALDKNLDDMASGLARLKGKRFAAIFPRKAWRVESRGMLFSFTLKPRTIPLIDQAL
jgi:hypothetical protein